MPTAQIVAAVTAFVSGGLAIAGLVDPGSIFAKPAVDAAIVGEATAGATLAVLLWAFMHHQSTLPPK